MISHIFSRSFLPFSLSLLFPLSWVPTPWFWRCLFHRDNTSHEVLSSFQFLWCRAPRGHALKQTCPGGMQREEARGSLSEIKQQGQLRCFAASPLLSSQCLIYNQTCLCPCTHIQVLVLFADCTCCLACVCVCAGSLLSLCLPHSVCVLTATLRPQFVPTSGKWHATFPQQFVLPSLCELFPE